MAEAFRRAPLRPVPGDAPGESARAEAAPLDPRPRVLDVARRRLLVLAAAGLAGAIAAVVLSQLQTPKYSATGRVFLVDPNRDFGLDPDRAPWTDPLRYTRMRAELVASGPVFERVANSLGTTPEDVADRIEVLPSREADFVKITGVAQTEDEAKRLVSLVQRHYEAVTTTAQQAPYRRAQGQIRRERASVLRELRRVNAAIAASPGSTELLAERSALRTDYRFLRSREATLAANAGLLGSGILLAETPVGGDTPVAPRPLRNAVIGGLLGSMLLLALLWWRAGREPLASSAELVEAALGGPLITEIPPPGHRHATDSLNDAFDQLAYAVLAARDARIVLTTPVRDSDRRPSIVLGLASSLAAAGKRPVLLDASESRALTEKVGRRSEPGLSEVGDGSADALALVRDLEVAPGRSVPFLSAGQHRRPPSRATRYERAVAQLLREFDAVVVEAPRARSLAAAVSAELRSVAVVVATPDTPLGAIADLRRELVLLEIPLLGFVYVRGRLGTDRRLHAVGIG
jgi:polysaccharide biosynthesis transport protein